MAQQVPLRGEVWMTDLGWQGKTRPSVVLSVRADDRDRDLVTCVPRTTSVRNSSFEVVVETPFLNAPGAFDVQGIVSVPRVRLLRRLGVLSLDSLQQIEFKLQHWLGIDARTGTDPLRNFCSHYRRVFPEGEELASRCDLYQHTVRPETQQLVVYTCLECQKLAAIGLEVEGNLSWIFPPDAN